MLQIINNIKERCDVMRRQIQAWVAPMVGRLTPRTTAENIADEQSIGPRYNRVYLAMFEQRQSAEAVRQVTGQIKFGCFRINGEWEIPRWRKHYKTAEKSV